MGRPPATNTLEDEMADINVERKSGGGRSILPWILGLLLLGALIWGLSRLLGGGDDEVNNATTADTTVTTTAP